MSFARRLWARLPAVVRGIVLGELVGTIGGLPPALALFANLRWTPSVPWVLPATAAWLWVCWRWLAGAGPPRATSARRCELMRSEPVGNRWPAAIAAGAFGLLACLALGALTATLAETPASAFRLGVDFSRFPWWTIVASIVSISVTAGMVEEAAFRGYMVTPIQHRHGWTAAALVSGGMFFLDHHWSHAYATFAFLPFFVAISAVHVLLVRATGSIRPSALLHAVFDVAVTPILFGIAGTAPWLARPAAPVEVGTLLATSAASWIAFRSLFARDRLERNPA